MEQLVLNLFESHGLPYLFLVSFAFEVFGLLVILVTWSWVCHGELVSDGRMLNTPAATAGIEALEIYFPGSRKNACL